MKKKVAVIFGGKSTEHQVSIVSGTSVIQHIPKEKYTVLPIYINQEGVWYQYTKSVEKITILPMGSYPQELTPIPNITEALQTVDIVFPVLHGRYGEDGSLQGMLEMLGKPYVGCGVLASSVAMDKALTKIVLQQAGIPQVPYQTLQKRKDGYVWKETGMQGALEEILPAICGKLAFPLFIKPANSGSSVGIYKVTTVEEALQVIPMANQYDSKIVLEKGVDAREIECAILGNQASTVGEIKPADTFYSYDAKYHNAASSTDIPANVTEEQKQQIQKLALRAFQAIDGKDLARVDFFLEKETGKIYLNEINTIPGFTTISMYPQLWEAEGISYSQLLDKLLSEK